jgi:hypothetical protein
MNIIYTLNMNDLIQFYSISNVLDHGLIEPFKGKIEEDEFGVKLAVSRYNTHHEKLNVTAFLSKNEAISALKCWIKAEIEVYNNKLNQLQLLDEQYKD